VLSDANVPVMDGRAVGRFQQFQMKVIILSTFDDDRYDSIRAGAIGYLLDMPSGRVSADQPIAVILKWDRAVDKLIAGF